jgi:hypothetical protein
MVIINVDHPDIEEFIEWKAKEEEKVAALVAGSKINATFLQAIMDEALTNGADRKTNETLNTLIKHAVHRGVPLNYIQRTLALVEQGFTRLNMDVFNTHYEGEAYVTSPGEHTVMLHARYVLVTSGRRSTSARGRVRIQDCSSTRPLMSGTHVLLMAVSTHRIRVASICFLTTRHVTWRRSI